MSLITSETPNDGAHRPSLILDGWDPATGEWAPSSPAGKLIMAVRAGNFINGAAAYARINRGTAFKWLARGREHRPLDDNATRLDVPEEHRPYVDFVEAVAHADGSFEVELVTLTLSAARQDNKFALQILARKYPQWRESTRVQVTDDRGEDLTMAALHSDPALVARAAQLAHEIEDARSRIMQEEGEEAPELADES
jgi:hypothetical protein